MIHGIMMPGKHRDGRESSQLGEGQGKNLVRKVAFEKYLEGWVRFQEAEIGWWDVHPCL